MSEKDNAAPQAVQAAVPEAIEQMAVDRYKVVPSHESMFHRWAVVAGNGTQQLYIGREVECQNVARKFMGAFLDGAFAAMQNTSPAHPAEGVPAQAAPFMWAIQEPDGSAYMDENCVSTSRGIVEAEVDGLNLGLDADDEPYKVVPVYLAATQPAAQGMDAGKLLAEKHTGMKVDYRGLLGQVQREIERSAPGHAEMLRQLQGHLQELGQRWYAGDTAVVDELLQLYCVERQARADLAAQAKQGGA